MRIAVVGTSCSGKTTLGAALADRLDLTHVDLDELHWGPNWTERPTFRQDVDEATAKEGWVCSGGYPAVRDLVWGRATHIVWLDLPFPVVFGRAVRRTFRRMWRREELFGGNRERWWMVFRLDWIPWWVVRTFWHRRRTFTRLSASPEHEERTIVRVRSRAQAGKLQEDFPS